MLELLGVLAIILILVGLLIPAVMKARKHTLKTAAKIEVRSIATAWERYLAEYGKWPSNFDNNATYAITGGVARMLEGDNPRGVPFIRFTHYNAETNPISPWGARSSSGSAGLMPPSYTSTI